MQFLSDFQSQSNLLGLQGGKTKLVERKCRDNDAKTLKNMNIVLRLTKQFIVCPNYRVVSTMFQMT